MEEWNKHSTSLSLQKPSSKRKLFGIQFNSYLIKKKSVSLLFLGQDIVKWEMYMINALKPNMEVNFLNFPIRSCLETQIQILLRRGKKSLNIITILWLKAYKLTNFLLLDTLFFPIRKKKRRKKRKRQLFLRQASKSRLARRRS